MYNVLLVDDEVDTLYALRESLDWRTLYVDRLLTADSADKAKEIMDRYPIHLLISDIEMPGTDGLKLWAWVREHYPETKGIFLTCHADFDYAQRAIALNVDNYLLKPAPSALLAEEITKVFSAIKEQKKVHELTNRWHENHSLRRRDYFSGVINRVIPLCCETLERERDLRGLTFPINTTIVPVLLLVQQWPQEILDEDVPRLEYSIWNTVREIFVIDENAGDVMLLNRGEILVLMFANENGVIPVSTEGACNELVHVCYRHLAVDISCRIGRCCTITELPDVIEELDAFGRLHAVHHRQIYNLGVKSTKTAPFQMPASDDWYKLLQSNKGSGIYDQIAQSIRFAEYNGVANVEVLQRIQQDFLQIVYSVLHDNNIQANLLFQDKHSFHMQERSLYSIENFLAWVKWILRRTKDCMIKAANVDPIIEQVCKYISANLKEGDLSRNSIANAVYLNPDYLSRLFKQKTGVVLSEYIQKQRLLLAKELLVETRISVSDIASDVGYSNYSYFNRVFKDNTGCTPIEYRKRFTVQR